MTTLTIRTILRRVDSFRLDRKDDSNSLKILTSPRRKSLEASFLFPTKFAATDEKMISLTEVAPAALDVAMEEFSDSKDETPHFNNLKAATEELENVGDLLLQQRFKPQLEFERKFLREYSRRSRSEVTETTAVSVKKRENKLPAELKNSIPPKLSENVFPCPQFEYCVSRHLRKEHIPAYSLTCAYKYIPSRRLLNIIIRQTGTLPDIKESKLSCSVVIEGHKEKQRVILAKSQNDKSFKSHEIVFHEQTMLDLQKKMLSLKLYIHSKPFTKKRIAEWKFELANVCAREKIEFKRFLFNI